MSSEQTKATIKVVINNQVLTKKFFLNENLASIREKLKNSVGKTNFLDKGEAIIELEDEKDFTLGEVIKDNKLFLQSDEKGIKFIVNGKMLFTKEIPLETNLKKMRDIIKDDLKGEFIFLDGEGDNIDQDGEEDFNTKEILKNGEIKIKLKDSISPTNNKITLEEAPISKEKINQSKIEEKPEIKKINFDLSKHKFIKKMNGLSLYKYSQVKRSSNHELVYHYHYDTFNSNDYRKAYIVLFVGKTGDGKSTAINAFFNIIKGIQLQDDFRFILIEEEKKTPGVSVTDGVHLYYLRDCNNEPIIVIDSQGYGDTRGRIYDEKINSAFQYVFSEVIDHINVVCFIANATHSRLDILTKYIFVSVTSLFSDDISENLIILATHANRNTMESGPLFISTISSDEAFKVINKKMNEKFWYASDNMLIFSKDLEKLDIYSFNQLTELYKEKVQKLSPKGVKNCANVLNLRRQLTVEINKLEKTFKTLTTENINLKEKQKVIDKYKEKLIEYLAQMKSAEEQKAKLKGKQLENFLRQINEDMDKKLAELKNQKVPQQKRVLKADSSAKYTVCHECKENCHNPCDCWFKFILKRCTIYPIFSNDCEECGHNKVVHECGYNHYVTETEEISIDNSKVLDEVKKNSEKQKNYISEQIENDNKEKNKTEAFLNDLQKKIAETEKDLDLKNREKDKIEKRVIEIEKEISITITKLQNYNENLSKICMYPEVSKTQNEYYQSLKDKMKDIGMNDKEQVAYLDKLIKENKNIENVKKIKVEDMLSNVEDSLKNIIEQ